MSEPIRVEVMGHVIEAPEPVGEAALALYGVAIGVARRGGVLDELLAAEMARFGLMVAGAKLDEARESGDVDAIAAAEAVAAEALRTADALALRHHMTAAVALAGTDGALAAARRTLTGGTLDGAPIVDRDFAALFARPGLYLLPYVAALIVWIRLGFFSAPGSQPGSQRGEAAAPSGQP